MDHQPLDELVWAMLYNTNSTCENEPEKEEILRTHLMEQFPEFEDGRIRNPQASVFEKSLLFAAEAHRGAYRKSSNIPYITHPVEVAGIVRELLVEQKGSLKKPDYEIMSAAALHDVVEDTPYTSEDIGKEFNAYIQTLVAYESENKRREMKPSESWHIRKEEFLQHLETAPHEAKMIALGDKLSNMRALAKDCREKGDDAFNKFNVRDKNLHAWYYCGVAKRLQDFEGSRALEEYQGLLHEVFGTYDLR